MYNVLFQNIVNISPAASSYDENIQTLKFSAIGKIFESTKFFALLIICSCAFNVCVQKNLTTF